MARDIEERIEIAQIARSSAHKAYWSNPTNAASLELNRTRDEHIALMRLDREEARGRIQDQYDIEAAMSAQFF